MAAPGSGASADLSYSRSCWNVGPWLGASACRAVYCMGQVIDNFGGASVRTYALYLLDCGMVYML